MTLLLSLITALSAFSIIMFFYLFKEYKKQEIIRRMERQLIAPKERKFNALEVLGFKKVLEKFDVLLKRAGIKKVDAENLILILSILNTFIFAFFIIKKEVFWAFLVPVLIFVTVPLILEKAAQKRYVKFNLQFAEAVQDIADYLKISGNIVNALEKVIDTAENPLKDEIKKIVAKVNSGISLYDALKDFARESGSPIVEAWVDSMVFAGQMKANTADICQKMSAKIKERIRQNNKISSFMKSTKSTVVMIIGITILLMLSTYTSGQMYADALSTPAGKFVLLYIILSYVVTTVFVFRAIDKQISSI
ncbi:type II secretion protein F [Caldanaerobacter subterraneus subsp. yonseiensis KB-1]|uniref:Type II secretion protein F n=1 Tax=Caldanaerobacter subterraneus subsp. yonseiensis KB-1 TaxID=1388761 RepID=U5CRB2_CALSX|nr:type II secretion system F family protein [Caldanaerobacter subterraneus]ERM91481.1 type II secretion protein F [Caldanaerobacter subterraneus subsp. yonseiensis KB-1]